jgi:hypothetical protein
MTMNVGDRVKLECGHQGRVVWLSEDGTTMAVKGSRRNCRTCYKATGTATVYLRPIAE